MHQLQEQNIRQNVTQVRNTPYKKINLEENYQKRFTKLWHGMIVFSTLIWKEYKTQSSEFSNSKIIKKIRNSYRITTWHGYTNTWGGIPGLQQHIKWQWCMADSSKQQYQPHKPKQHRKQQRTHQTPERLCTACKKRKVQT